MLVKPMCLGGPASAPFAVSSTRASAVSHTVMAPSGRARRLFLPSLVDTAGRARGLSGAPQGARDLAAAPYRAASVLIPMGG